MEISVNSQKGDNSTEAWLKRMAQRAMFANLGKFGERGVEALSSATPIDSGETASAWGYKILKKKHGYAIVWTNSHLAGTAPVAILLQYGHGTGSGGFVSGRDYINPAMRSIFDDMANEAWKVVTSK